MRRKSWIVIVAVTVAIALLMGGDALAKQGGNGGGGGGGKPGGGGGGGTPVNPVIVYVDAPDLMVMDADGANPAVLVAGAASTKAYSVRPHWSPNGQWVVFNSSDSGLGGPGIYLASIDGQTVKQVASTTVMPTHPNWGPVTDSAGNHLVVFQASEPYGSSNLFLLRLDPTTLNPVGTPDALTDEDDDYADWDPTWAPDGRTIAAFRDLKNAGGGTYSLVLYTLDETLAVTGPIIKVLNTTVTWGVIGQELDFANGSNQLTMIGRVENDYDVYKIDLGSNPVSDAPGSLINVTDNTTDDELHPSWSPDDSQIVFFRNAPRNKNDGIEIIDPSGASQVRLLKGPLSAPDWRP